MEVRHSVILRGFELKFFELHGHGFRKMSNFGEGGPRGMPKVSNCLIHKAACDQMGPKCFILSNIPSKIKVQAGLIFIRF